MFILAGFSQILGMFVFRALQVLKWFDFPVVSYVDAKLVCRLTQILFYFYFESRPFKNDLLINNDGNTSKQCI